jgi:hypothetical protein
VQKKVFVGFNLSEENELAVALENNCCIYPLNCAPQKHSLHTLHTHTQTNKHHIYNLLMEKTNA